jgi:hypothetical protein
MFAPSLSLRRTGAAKSRDEIMPARQAACTSDNRPTGMAPLAIMSGRDRSGPIDPVPTSLTTG